MQKAPKDIENLPYPKLTSNQIKSLICDTFEFFLKEETLELEKKIDKICSILLNNETIQSIIDFIYDNISKMRNMFVWVVKRLKSFQQPPIIMIALIYLALSSFQEKQLLPYQTVVFEQNAQKKQLISEQSADPKLFQQPTFLERLKQNSHNDGLGEIFKGVGLFLKKKDKEQALKCFRIYNCFYHNNESCHLLGQILIELKRAHEGVQLLAKIDFKNYDLRVLFYLGDAYFNLGLIQKCQTCLKTAISLDKQLTIITPQAYSKLGRLYFYLASFEKSLQKYIRSLTLNLKRNTEEGLLYIQTLFKVSNVYFHMLNYKTAAQLLEKLIDYPNICESYLLKCYYDLGECYYKLTNFQKALYYLRKVQEITPNCFEVIQRMAHSYLNIKRYEDSKEYFEKIRAIQDQNAMALTNLAYIDFKISNHLQTSTLLEAALASNSSEAMIEPAYKAVVQEMYGNSDASSSLLQDITKKKIKKSYQLCKLGQICLSSLTKQKSLVYFMESIKYNPQNDQALNNIGALCCISNRFGQAKPFFERSVKANPQSIYGLLMLGRIYVGEGCTKEGNECFDRILQIDPENLAAKDQIEKCYVNVCNKVKSLRIISVDNHPSSFQFFLRQAIMQYQTWQYSKAKINFEKIMDVLSSNDQLLFCISQQLHNNGIQRYEIQFLGKCLSANASHSQALQSLCNILKNKQKLRTAQIKILEGVLELRPSADLSLIVAKLYLKKKNYSMARTVTVAALKRETRESMEQLLQLLEKIYKMLDYKQETYLMKMLEIRPNNWNLHKRLARIHKNAKNIQREIFHLEEVINNSWAIEEPLRRLADIYKSTGNKDKYLSCMLELVQIQVYNFNLHVEIAEVYDSGQQVEKAMAYYAKALQMEPTKQEIYQKLQQYCKNVMQGQSSKGQICFLVHSTFFTNKNCSFLSYFYRYYKNYSQSLSYFLLWIQQSKLQSVPTLIKYLFQDKIRELSVLAGKDKDQDFYLKKLILWDYIGDDEQVLECFCELMFGKRLQYLKYEINAIVDKFEQMNNQLLCSYSPAQVKRLRQMLAKVIHQNVNIRSSEMVIEKQSKQSKTNKIAAKVLG